MTLRYGFVRATLAGAPVMKGSRRPHEVQYHLHVALNVDGGQWDVAINVGTTDDDDRLKYKLAFDYANAMLGDLAAAPEGPRDLTDMDGLPALDFMRGGILDGTGPWRDSDVMDGSDHPEPVASLKRLLVRAHEESLSVFVFGRFYTEGNGIHDVHMNQGSTKRFIHRPGDDANDHNDVWQDGALLIMLPEDRWVAYFSAFTQQHVPTDDLGNPAAGAAPLA